MTEEHAARLKNSRVGVAGDAGGMRECSHRSGCVKIGGARVWCVHAVEVVRWHATTHHPAPPSQPPSSVPGNVTGRFEFSTCNLQRREIGKSELFESHAQGYQCGFDR